MDISHLSLTLDGVFDAPLDALNDIYFSLDNSSTRNGMGLEDFLKIPPRKFSVEFEPEFEPAGHHHHQGLLLPSSSAAAAALPQQPHRAPLLGAVAAHSDEGRDGGEEGWDGLQLMNPYAAASDRRGGDAAPVAPAAAAAPNPPVSARGGRARGRPRGGGRGGRGRGAAAAGGGGGGRYGGGGGFSPLEEAAAVSTLAQVAAAVAADGDEVSSPTAYDDGPASGGSAAGFAPYALYGTGGAAAAAPAPVPSGGKRKRFLWTEDLHTRFVAALFDYGVAHATPKTLFELMQSTTGAAAAGMTSDHIKSHLQKYRNNSRAGRDMFQADYAQAVQDAERRAQDAAARGAPLFPVQFSTYALSASSSLGRGQQEGGCDRCKHLQTLMRMGVGVAEASEFSGPSDLPSGGGSDGSHAAAAEQHRPAALPGPQQPGARVGGERAGAGLLLQTPQPPVEGLSLSASVLHAVQQHLQSAAVRQQLQAAAGAASVLEAATAVGMAGSGGAAASSHPNVMLHVLQNAISSVTAYTGVPFPPAPFAAVREPYLQQQIDAVAAPVQGHQPPSSAPVQGHQPPSSVGASSSTMHTQLGEIDARLAAAAGVRAAVASELSQLQHSTALASKAGEELRQERASGDASVPPPASTAAADAHVESAAQLERDELALLSRRMQNASAIHRTIHHRAEEQMIHYGASTAAATQPSRGDITPTTRQAAESLLRRPLDDTLSRPSLFRGGSTSISGLPGAAEASHGSDPSGMLPPPAKPPPALLVPLPRTLLSAEAAPSVRTSAAEILRILGELQLESQDVSQEKRIPPPAFKTTAGLFAFLRC